MSEIVSLPNGEKAKIWLQLLPPAFIWSSAVEMTRRNKNLHLLALPVAYGSLPGILALCDVASTDASKRYSLKVKCVQLGIASNLARREDER